MKYDELCQPIVNHHVRCVTNAQEQAKIISDLIPNVDFKEINFTCVCKQVLTVDEHNELLAP